MGDFGDVFVSDSLQFASEYFVTFFPLFIFRVLKEVNPDRLFVFSMIFRWEGDSEFVLLYTFEELVAFVEQKVLCGLGVEQISTEVFVEFWVVGRIGVIGFRDELDVGI